MRAVVQRVKSARCTVNGAVTGEIGVGLLVFVGVGVEDTERDVVKCADHIIDLGPEGGAGGGSIVAQGTPEEGAACPASFTGQYLKRLLP